MVTCKAILTLESGYRTIVTLMIPNPSMLRFPREAEEMLVKGWNKAQPNAACKAVSIHILRN